MDSPSLPRIEVRANYVIVQGYLGAGTPSRQFSQRLFFTLTPNTAANRSSYLYTDREPADVDHPRSLGHKVFAVVSEEEALSVWPTMVLSYCALLAERAREGEGEKDINICHHFFIS